MHYLPLAGCVGRNPQLCSTSLPQNFSSFLHEMCPNDPSCDVSAIYWNKMALIRREREHEEQDLTTMNDTATIQALRDCGLLKFF